MLVESLTAALVVLAALAPLAWLLCRGRPVSARIAAFGLVAALSAAVGGGALPYRRPTPRPLPEHRPIEVPVDGYVGSDTCAACHPREYETWHASYHRTMTQVASEASVLGDFDDVRVEVAGRRYHLTRSGGGFWAEMDDPDHVSTDGTRPRIRRRIVMTTGSHHYQVYWYELGKSRRLGMLPLAWRIPEARWVPRSDVFLRPPRTEHQVSERDRWNHTCIKCHATHGRPRFFEATRDGDGPERPAGYDTHVAELGISCESCHGPAGEHVALNQSPARRYGMHLSAERGDPSIVHPERLDHRRSSQVCGQCHGMTFIKSYDDALAWSQHGYAYRPGDELTDTRYVLTADTPADHPVMAQLTSELDQLENRFWPDGAARSRGREYNELLETACFLEGELSCLSCHTMHPAEDDPRPLAEWANDQLLAHADSNRPGAHTDESCLQCHEGYRARVAEHSRHAESSPGSRCINCHMPPNVYGLLKAVRSHRIASPSARVSAETGRPNACNLCHLDRTLAWTAETLEEWYGQPVPPLSADEREVAASVLWALTGDAGQRALAAWNMAHEPAVAASGGVWTPLFLMQLLDDPYAAVRFVAFNALRGLPGFETLEYDSTAPSAERRAVAQKAIELYRASGHAARLRPRPEILLDPRGVLMEQRFGELLRRRDDRPVAFSE